MEDTDIHEWVQASSVVPGRAISPNGIGVNEPSSMHSAASEASTMNLDELEAELNHQVNHERAQHAATKQLLKFEREKVHNLEQELDDMKRLADTLATSNLMNVKLLQATMKRIEPDVKEILKTMAPSNISHSSPYEGAATMGRNSQNLSDDVARGPTAYASDLPEAALQLSAPISTDQRSSILYDVLPREMVDNVEMISDFHSDIQEQENFNQESVQPDGLLQADEAGNKQQSFTHGQGGLSFVPHVEELDSRDGVSKSVDRVQGLGEFHSLDEAFENDFFSKPVRGSGTARSAPKKESSDDTLIDVGLEEGGLTKSGVVSSVPSQIGMSKPEKPPTYGEDHNKLTAGSVVGRKESTIEHPIIGVEARTKHAIPLKLDRKIRTAPPKLSSLPTLRLPESFLSRAELYRSSTTSSGSTPSSPLKATQETTLAQARVPPLPTHPQIKALQKIKISDTNNSSEKTIRPSSRQRRVQGLAPKPSSNVQDDRVFEANGASLQPTANYQEAPTRSTQDQVSDAPDFAGPPGANLRSSGLLVRDSGELAGPTRTGLRPSSGPGDNYSVIPVHMMNYLAPIDWKMSKHHRPLFTSDFEKNILQFCQGNILSRNKQFWVHDLRYEPKLDEPNTHRTVQIDHIPKGTGVLDVLKEVCYGDVESIQLFDMGRMKGPEGLMSCPYLFARVIFIETENATNFIQYALRKPLVISGKQVRVYMQMEATYPRTPQVDKTIFDWGMLRIFSVFGETRLDPRPLLDFLQRDCRFDVISCKQEAHQPQGDETDRFESKTILEFRSVLQARKAYDALAEDYPDVVSFMLEPDYCARDGDEDLA